MIRKEKPKIKPKAVFKPSKTPNVPKRKSP